ncbi:DUF3299 domain-containing protein [Actomonas aquatica]|uniref:DUF3299 domain-containing protein n=1 Tax=Actomonas aquatica TaxID=2866162 RepID=A0ABZ1CC74_9BACT|nr:DUF3299 domain-containing protein [Opitutus sp. WL0086]WRQ89041.1 DUF3299 domain-containing protein [Opitutus sp. WL0086]
MPTRPLRRLTTAFWATCATLIFAMTTTTLSAEEKINLRDYAALSFDTLAKFTIDLNNLEDIGDMTEVEYAASKIPPEIMALDGKKVCIPAYMLPLRFDDDGVVEFLGMADTNSCCYGGEPKLTEIILVTMKNGATKSLMDSPLFLFGTLRVGPVDDDGFVTAVYTMECDRVSW